MTALRVVALATDDDVVKDFVTCLLSESPAESEKNLRRTCWGDYLPTGAAPKQAIRNQLRLMLRVYPPPNYPPR